MGKVFTIGFLFIYIALTYSAHAATLTTKDGKKYEWDGYYDNGSQYCTRRAGGSFCIDKSNVASFSKGGGSGLKTCEFKGGANQSAAAVQASSSAPAPKSGSKKTKT